MGSKLLPASKGAERAVTLKASQSHCGSPSPAFQLPGRVCRRKGAFGGDQQPCEEQDGPVPAETPHLGADKQPRGPS